MLIMFLFLLFVIASCLVAWFCASGAQAMKETLTSGQILPLTCLAILTLLALFLVSCISVANASNAKLATALARIENLTQGPDDNVDILAAKFAIDRLLDPTSNEATARKRIDALYAAWVARIPEGAPNDRALELLLDTVYRPGPWNDGRPFGYDFDDPYGVNFPNKSLARYLETRLGNCVTMPTLLVVLGQRRGLPITLSQAPAHVFAKYRSDSGDWYNVEATAGGFKLDSSYKRDLEITDLAIKRGTYLRPLSRKESVGLLMGDLSGQLLGRRQLKAVMRVDRTARSLYPSDVSQLLTRRSVLLRAMDIVANRYHQMIGLAPQELVGRYLVWMETANVLEAHARMLGWKPMSEEMEREYQKVVQKARGNAQ